MHKKTGRQCGCRIRRDEPTLFGKDGLGFIGCVSCKHGIGLHPGPTPVAAGAPPTRTAGSPAGRGAAAAAAPAAAAAAAAALVSIGGAGAMEADNVQILAPIPEEERERFARLAARNSAHAEQRRDSITPTRAQLPIVFYELSEPLLEAFVNHLKVNKDRGPAAVRLMLCLYEPVRLFTVHCADGGVQIATRLSKFLAFVTRGEGLMGSDALATYMSAVLRNEWITFLDEYKDGTGKKMTSSGKANFHVAVVKFLRWIDETTGPIPALGNRTMTPKEALDLSKVLKGWERLLTTTFKAAKDESIKNNTAEKLVSSMPVGQLFQMRCVLHDTVEPALQRLADQDNHTDEEKVLFFNLLMYALMLTRPCRPGTYSSWYVVCCRSLRPIAR